MLKKLGFTLLEIVIVTLIINLLICLVIPRYIKVLEYARGVEALINLDTLRQAAFRYYLPHMRYTDMSVDKLDIENPSKSPSAYFSYNINAQPHAFNITATRNTFEDGDNVSSIVMSQDGVLGGSGIYSHIVPSGK